MKRFGIMVALAVAAVTCVFGDALVEISSALQKQRYEMEAKRSPALGEIWHTYCLGAATIGGVTNFVYTGSAITPEPVVKLGGVTLTKTTDYSVSYSNNTAVGTAYCTVKAARANLVGSQTVRFRIKAAQ